MINWKTFHIISCTSPRMFCITNVDVSYSTNFLAFSVCSNFDEGLSCKSSNIFYSRLFSAGRPLGTRKNSVHCLWFLCCCTQTLHRTQLETFSYFTHVDVCFGFLITALLCKLRVDINHQSADLENGWLAHVTSRVVQPRYRTQYLHNF